MQSISATQCYLLGICDSIKMSMALVAAIVASPLCCTVVKSLPNLTRSLLMVLIALSYAFSIHSRTLAASFPTMACETQSSAVALSCNKINIEGKWKK